MIRLDLNNDHFFKQKSKQCKLSILVGVDSFAYMVSNGADEVLFIRDYDFTLEKNYPNLASAMEYLEKEEPNLWLAYQQTRIGFLGKNFSLIPDRLFHPDAVQTYLSHLTPLGPDQRIRTDVISRQSVRGVYAFDADIGNWVDRCWPSGRTVHLQSALLHEFQAFAGTQEGHHVYCHVRDGQMILFVFDRHFLQLTNIFSYRSSRDFLYFLLLVFDQLELHPREVPVTLSGHILPDAEIFHLLQRYCKTVQFCSLPASWPVSGQLGAYPAYFFFDLLAIRHADL